MEHENGDWLKVDWELPAWSGARVEEWQIKYRYLKSGRWSAWEHQFDDGDGFSEDSIYDVEKGVRYEVQVRGRAYGWGAWSASDYAETRAQGGKSSVDIFWDNFWSHDHPGLTEVGVGYDECWSGNQTTNHTHDGQRHWHCPARSGGGGSSADTGGGTVLHNCSAWYSNGVLVDHSHPGTGCIQDWYYRSGHSHQLATGEEKPHSH